MPSKNSLPRTAELFPKSPVAHVIAPIVRFMHIQAASGVVLIGATLLALYLANSFLALQFAALWHTEIGITIGTFSIEHSLEHWINDALMVIFFFVTGLEVKRELVLGELRDFRRASLPIAAALGGMIVPAGIYLALQWNGAAPGGWGIPMATDIAFVVGCMALLGPRVPYGLRIMLLSLAIADDIGAILVIAVGYTKQIHWWWLALGGAGIAFTVFIQRIGVRSFLVYTVVGIIIWLGFEKSGVHATIAGVILGVLTPVHRLVNRGLFSQVLDRARDFVEGDWDEHPHPAERAHDLQRAARESVSPQEYLEHLLHPWVAFLIMPVFALANAGVAIQSQYLQSPIALAVALGLFLGKPIGIVLFSWLAIRLGIARLPTGVTWPMLVGGGFLCGIGFTMALFIAGLAVDEATLPAAKIGVLGGSLASAVVGMIILIVSSRAKGTPTSAELAEPVGVH
jgi:NhaA family Na+:H+ antiporter